MTYKISAGFSTARLVDLSTGLDQALPSPFHGESLVVDPIGAVPTYTWTWHYMDKRDWKRLVRFFGLTTHSRKVMHRMARREARKARRNETA